MKRYVVIMTAMMGLGAFPPLAASQVTDPEIETLDDDRSKGDRQQVRGPITIIRPASLFLASLDQDSDYKISKAEFETGVSQAFSSADTDNSGQLSLFELEDWRMASLGSMDAMPGNFSFDDNHDNRIEVDEFKLALEFEFDRNDEDEDGVISFSDLVRVMEMPRQRSRDGSDRRSEGGQGRGQRPTRRAGAN